MKKPVIVSGIVLLVFNILLGLLLSKYSLFNMCLNSAVIILTTAAIALLKKIVLKDAFYISLSGTFLLFGIIAFTLGFFSPATLVDNWVVIVDIILVVIGSILTFITNYISRTIK